MFNIRGEGVAKPGYAQKSRADTGWDGVGSEKPGGLGDGGTPAGPIPVSITYWAGVLVTVPEVIVFSFTRATHCRGFTGD